MAIHKAEGRGISVEILEELGVINEKKNLRLRYVKWNDGEPKYDIRPWYTNDDGQECCRKGITLTGEELEQLHKLIGDIING